MFRIPSLEKKFTVANKTDLFGNIYATRNINFDSEGVLKLSEGSIAFISEKDDANFDTAIGFGNIGSGMGALSTIDKVYNLDLNTNVAISQDVSANTPTGGTRSHAKWWQDCWYQTQSTSLVRAVTTSFPSWSTSLLSLTNSVNHPIEVFKNRNTLVIGNGNVVTQIDTSHSVAGQSQLTLPLELEVTSIAYGNNMVAIGTKNKQTNNGSKNTPAYIFLWDGTTASANIGISVESTYVLAVSAYQESSFVCLTGNGQLLKFNGSGFDVLANLPFYYDLNIDWVDDFPNFITRNGTIRTDGDIVYINITNVLQTHGDEVNINLKPEFAGGIYCYDPYVGLYHKYSSSISLVKSVTVSDVDLSTNEITAVSSVVTPTGTPVRFYSAGATIGGLISSRLYYVIKTSSTTFKLATTYTNAINNVPIDLTSGDATFKIFSFYDMKDFGQFYSNRVGFIDLLGSSPYRTHGSMIWSSELNTPTMSPTDSAYAGFTVQDLENRGWFMTPRIESSSVSDTFRKLLIKFQPLKKDIDKIVIKYRTDKNNNLPVIVPEYSLTDAGVGTWVDTDTLTTSIDLTNCSVGDEIEIISGSGSGQTAHILSKSYDTGTWTIQLDEPIKYVVASDKCWFIIDNWKRLDTGTIDNTNVDGYKDIAIGLSSKWIQFKIELRGIGVTIEELQIINSEQLPSK